jgi:hypothetical protein
MNEIGLLISALLLQQGRKDETSLTGDFRISFLSAPERDCWLAVYTRAVLRSRTVRSLFQPLGNAFILVSLTMMSVPED